MIALACGACSADVKRQLVLLRGPTRLRAFGASNRVRAVMMTALTAILGLLPAALALRPAWDSSGRLTWVEGIGSQTQRPLAIVVVGGMITTLFLTRYLMPVLYSFYGNRQPPAGSGGLAH